MTDDLLDAACEQLPNIALMYRCFRTKRPVMLFDIQEQRIYAYPYKEFRDEMNARSQASLKCQYDEAVAQNKMVVFVRDNERRKLVSYTLDIEHHDLAAK